MTHAATYDDRFNLEKAALYLDGQPAGRLRVLSRNGEIGHFCRTMVRILLSHHDCNVTQAEIRERAGEALARREAAT